MEFNPLNVKYAQIERAICDLANRQTELDAQLNWYRSTDPDSLQLKRRGLETELTKLADAITSIEVERAANQKDIADTTSQLGSLLNPANWFAGPQVALRRTRKQLYKTKKSVETRLTESVTSQERIKQEILDLTSTIDRHLTFNYEETNAAFQQITSQMADAKTALEIVGQRKSQVDAKLGPLLEELRKLKTTKDDAESKLRKAKRLDDDLTHADNSYERAMTHEECERQFGTGSPRSVIRSQEKIIRRVERDYAKAESRVKKIGEKAAREITDLVIDGNNMCYEGGKFIGLSALNTAIPILAREYTVTIVFDAAIRRMLRTDDAGLRGKLGPHATVHVVATAEQADETLLELAAANTTTYVLSNDRFADYREKDAVKQSRIIRHEIVNGSVLVHDLFIAASYT